MYSLNMVLMTTTYINNKRRRTLLGVEIGYLLVMLLCMQRNHQREVCEQKQSAKRKIGAHRPAA
jgi:hypothetical protein